MNNLYGYINFRPQVIVDHFIQHFHDRFLWSNETCCHCFFPWICDNHDEHMKDLTTLTTKFCNQRYINKIYFAIRSSLFLMLFLFGIGWDSINKMLVDCIVAHILNLFCMCFGYVPRSRNFGVSCFYCWDNTTLVQYSLGVQYCGVSFMERLWGMKVCMLLMFFIFLMDTSLSPRFLLLFHSSELKIWSFGVQLRHWLFG